MFSHRKKKRRVTFGLDSPFDRPLFMNMKIRCLRANACVCHRNGADANRDRNVLWNFINHDRSDCIFSFQYPDRVAVTCRSVRYAQGLHQRFTCNAIARMVCRIDPKSEWRECILQNTFIIAPESPQMESDLIRYRCCVPSKEYM